MKDQVYQQPRPHIVDFAFDQNVVDVFPDMIRRSVPGYEVVIPLTGLMAARHLNEGAHMYDLGCSLGATMHATLAQLGDTKCTLTGVDNSQPMIDRARSLMHDTRVTYVCDDIRTHPLSACRVITMNFILQFIPPPERAALIARVYAALEPGGMLLLSEKIRFDDAQTHAYYDSTHLAYKRANGYSELEVSQKRSALENVMIIDTEDVHHQRLREAGFALTQSWYRCMNWVSVRAVK